MPNLGLYSILDGPVGNPADLLPMGKIDEAEQAYEQMAEDAIKARLGIHSYKSFD